MNELSDNTDNFELTDNELVQWQNLHEWTKFSWESHPRYNNFFEFQISELWIPSLDGWIWNFESMNTGTGRRVWMGKTETRHNTRCPETVKPNGCRFLALAMGRSVLPSCTVPAFKSNRLDCFFLLTLRLLSFFRIPVTCWSHPISCGIKRHRLILLGALSNWEVIVKPCCSSRSWVSVIKISNLSCTFAQFEAAPRRNLGL